MFIFKNVFAWSGESGTTCGLSAIDTRLGIFLGGLRGGVVGLNLSCAFLSNSSAWPPMEELAPRGEPCGEGEIDGEGEVAGEMGSREIEEDSELSTWALKALMMLSDDGWSLAPVLTCFLCLINVEKTFANLVEISLTSSCAPLYKVYIHLNNCVLLSRLFFVATPTNSVWCLLHNSSLVDER